MARDEDRWGSRGRRGALFAIPAVVVLAVAWPTIRRLTESRALAALPPAPAGSPNVLLVVLDAARARDVGFVQPQAGTTPLLDRWASEGAVFTQAFSVGPWTLPSHASMLSGRYATELARWLAEIEARCGELGIRYAPAFTTASARELVAGKLRRLQITEAARGAGR